MSYWIVNQFKSSDVAKLFAPAAAANISRYWPAIQNELIRNMLGNKEIIIGYAVATIRAETGLFAPIDEEQAPENTSSPDRPFGRYDRPRLTPDGHVEQLKDKKGRPRYDSKGRPVYHDLGNRPNLKGTANEADLHEWNTFRGWGELPDNATLRRGVLSTPRAHRPIPLVDYRDGWRFRGRGFVQLTGRYNYEMASPHVGVDLINDPDKANDPEIAAKLMVWFLTRPGKVAKIEKCLSAWPRDYATARAVVNGMTHGLSQFTTAYKKAEDFFSQKKIDLVKWMASN